MYVLLYSVFLQPKNIPFGNLLILVPPVICDLLWSEGTVASKRSPILSLIFVFYFLSFAGLSFLYIPFHLSSHSLHPIIHLIASASQTKERREGKESILIFNSRDHKHILVFIVRHNAHKRPVVWFCYGSLFSSNCQLKRITSSNQTHISGSLHT